MSHCKAAFYLGSSGISTQVDVASTFDSLPSGSWAVTANSCLPGSNKRRGLIEMPWAGFVSPGGTGTENSLVGDFAPAEIS